MKLKMYCSKCGNANEYISEKPNFCQKCGYAFAHAQSVPSPEENKQPSCSYDIQELDIEIITNKMNVPTLDDLLGAPEQKWSNKELGIKGKRGRPRKLNKDQVQKDFRKEAGSLKKQKPK